MGIGPYTMLAIRLPVVDYLSPVYSDALTMVMRRPDGSVAQSALLVAKPFKGGCKLLFYTSSRIFSIRNTTLICPWVTDPDIES